ncbi:MAG TPA: UDP-N-acetylmuramate dehydrogenase [Gemmataceae bacterium]|jgi:UDP-N-acetylmuramate dehydrogenase|nr:UDP-N-acetylmuramate dehydrogenase [Gemmataceae bacterium]
MPDAPAQHPLAEFADIVKLNEPLAPFTYLKIGGPAQMLVQPRTVEELSGVVRTCFQNKIPLRVLGGGGNVLIKDEGVRGAVLRLSEPAFTQITVQGKRVRAGAGAALSAFISEAARHGLAGLETLVGIPGSIGGALRCNAGDRSGEIGQYVRLVEVLDEKGQVQVRERDELRFAHRWSNLDDPVLLAAEFELEPDQVDAIVKRLRKAWISRKANQPLTFQAAGRMFKDPRGLSASTLIAQAGQTSAHVGGAEVSERDANFCVAQPGTSYRDVLRLMDLVRSQVKEKTGVDLELEITLW